MGRSYDEQIEDSLRRIRSSIEQSRGADAPIIQQIVVATGVHVVDRIAAKIAEKEERRQNRHERRAAEHEQRRAHRELKQALRRKASEASDRPKGLVFAAAGLVALGFALTQPHLWWMLFVALGFGMSAATHLGRAHRRELEGRREREGSGASEPAAASRAEAAPVTPVPAAAPTPPDDPRVIRIQQLSDQLLADVASGPALFKGVIKHPKETIEGLRQACLAIARRERELRAALAAQDDTTLATERAHLAERVAAEPDAIVRDRLAAALRALDEQRTHRAEVATAASRLEAENTRILYTLESLHMQLLRARSTDAGAPELGGKLRQSLEDLTHEVDAVAEALEWVEAPGRVADTTPPAAGVSAAEAARRAGARVDRQSH